MGDGEDADRGGYKRRGSGGDGGGRDGGDGGGAGGEAGGNRGPDRGGGGAAAGVSGDDELLGEVRAYLVQKTRKAGRGLHYAKSKRIGDAVGASAREVAQRMVRLERGDDPAIDVERWGGDNGVTWAVRPA